MSPPAADAAAVAGRLPRARRRALGAPALSSGIALGYLSVVVLIPLAALVAKATEGGWQHFWQVAWNPESRSALELTLGVRERSRRCRDVRVLASAPIRAARLPIGAARWSVGRERDRPRTEHQAARERDRWKPDLSSHVRPPETLTPEVVRTRGL